MSDQTPGPPPLPQSGPPAPGWWKASDGNWYPPQDTAPPPPPPPAQTSSQTYGQDYGAAPRSNGFATAALVLGILGLVTCWLVGLGVIPGILAVVFGILGRKRAKEMIAAGNHLGANSGLATAGIVLGVLAAIASVLFFIVLVAVADDLDEINTDPSDGVCNPDRFLQDPDC